MQERLIACHRNMLAGQRGELWWTLSDRAVLRIRARSRFATRAVAQALLCSFEARRTVGQQLLVSELITAGTHLG
ncbi:hypothetical protein CDO26_19235 (plasmid) [Sinorhizobium meliloti]|nr:hypothetical protein CDO26_19235 [Sinorhizobium meliloti]ASP93465.1 hypothetical protein CDO25_19910 [Sinorhizobium meliloti]